MKSNQINSAELLGLAAFVNGVKCAPCLDKELLKMLGDRPVGKTPKGEASTVELMKAWQKGWTKANLLVN